MQVICISRGSYMYGKELAERLSVKLGFECFSREMLTDQATEHGIPVGKVETAIVKRRPLSEELAIEVDRFKAFITASLCERALRGGIVYHGRTGHLVLPGLSNTMRVRAIADMEKRISYTMNRLRLSREKARLYNDQVDEDIRRWVRTLYNVDWDDPSLYDVTINSDRLTVENASIALMQMAKLPEFLPTPASEQSLRDLHLAARCRLAIGDDKRTHPIKATVRAEKGAVSVTFLPRQADLAEAIPKVLENIDGLRSLVCTVATTSIVFVQERFDSEEESLQELIEVAEKWNAAVEVVRFLGGQKGEEESFQAAGGRPTAEPSPEPNGGILDDAGEFEGWGETQDGFAETMHKLIIAGRAGGSRTICGDPKDLVARLNRTEDYSLVVVGKLFASKEEAIQKRMKRDLISMLGEHLRVPVIGTEDLKSRYLFGARQAASLIAYAVLGAVLYATVFTFQEPILTFLTRPGTHFRLGAAAAIAVFSPVAAFVIGGFYHNMLRLAKME